MSTPTSRRPSNSVTSSPSNRSASPALGNTMSIEPKSEYLRHALDAQRAKQATPAPAPAPSSAPTPPTTITESKFTALPTISDPWLDQAKNEEYAPKTTLSRYARRPSDGPASRKAISREQQMEVDKLKEALFSLNMKLELVRKQNNDLKDEVEEANNRIAELEHFEDETYDLRESNNNLELKVQQLYEELVELRERNVEILQIQDESVQNMEKQNGALEEAAEIILRMEQQKQSLAKENARLQEQVRTLQEPTAGCHHTGLDGNSKYPERVHSIDDSRPSTSHFDSDYYSQPGSPRIKDSKESLPSVTVSDRARDFLTLNKESKKSTQDLKKRMSNASARSKSAVPEVPQIPDSYRENRGTAPQYPVRTPRRMKTSSQLSPNVSSPSGSTRTDQDAPRTPTNQMDGLRGMFRANLTLNTSTHSSRASPGHAESPLETRNLRAPQGSTRPIPPRHPSRQTQAPSPREQHPTPLPRPESEKATQEAASEWDVHSPRSSMVSDLTTEPDRDARTRWWKTVDGLTSAGGSFTHASAVPLGVRSTHQSNLREQNFLFNPAESDDEFLAKMKGGMSKRP